MTPKYRLVFFDVDSTLVTIEGIDVLAAGNPEVARLTAAAMNGEIPLDQVFQRRLEIVRPTRADVDALGRQYIECLVDGAAETITALRDAGAAIHFVTAGIEQAVLPLAAHLGVNSRHVHAVRLRFGPAGEYEDFDRRSPLTRPTSRSVTCCASDSWRPLTQSRPSLRA